MNNETTPFLDGIENEGSSLGAKISDTAKQVKDKVSEFGRSTADKIDSNRDAAASGLQKAATAIHDNAGSLPGGEKVTGFAHDAANSLASTANYVRDHDVNKMMADVESLVKRNPGPSLLIAVGLGFLLGRAFTTNNND